MFEGNSSYTSTGENVTSVDVLSCTTNTKVKALLNTELADKVEHKISVTFNNKHPDEISYSISATYTDKTSYDGEGRIWVTNYGLYMGSNNLKEDSIKNTFSTDGSSKAWANFYAKVSDINTVTEKIFLLSDDSYIAVRSYDMKKLAEYYNSLGFNCEINNKETK